MPTDPLPAIFWEIHNGLPREGPGDDASTCRAFGMARGLPARPRILDVGCGPGMQTLALAGISGSTVTALDAHRPFLDALGSRAAAVGISGRIATVAASMRAMPFADAAFDLIWCEGAIYVMGFGTGLAAWRRLLRPRGCIAVTEPCWLAAEIPEPVKAFWAEYPAMTTIQHCREIVAACGYAELGHFVLPESAWWDDYYDPMVRRIAMLRERHADDPAALAALTTAQHEINLYRTYSHLYGYVFFVMQRTPNASA